MGAPKTPPAPPAPPPPATFLDPSILAARDRARAKRRGRYGRQSTILTGPMGTTGKAPLSQPMLTPQKLGA